jgi:hypothetical protein
VRVGRDLWLVVVCLVLAGLAAVGSIHDHQSYFGVWFFGLGAVLVVVRTLRRRRHDTGTAQREAGITQRAVSRKERVAFDDHSIRRDLSDGRVETIAWQELDEISIVTTDQGPWVDDVYWLFTNRDRSRGCVVSSAVEGFKELLPRIQLLPGFDNRTVITAMGSTSNQRFVVWKKP